MKWALEKQLKLGTLFIIGLGCSLMVAFLYRNSFITSPAGTAVAGDSRLAVSNHNACLVNKEEDTIFFVTCGGIY